MITRRPFGTHLPQRFMCQPGPQRQPTVSIGKAEALGFAIGMACEPAPDSNNVLAASANGRKYLESIRFSVICPYLRRTEARTNPVGAR